MYKKLTAVTVFALMALFAIGCSDNSLDSENSGTLNLEEEFGGYSATSEAVAFADLLLTADAIGDTEFDDPMLSDESAGQIMGDPEAGLYHLRAVWGRLEFDSTVTNQTDWTGSLTITRGAEVVRRLIRFEPSQDYVLPRTERKLIEWVSKTTVHHDGLAVDLFVPPVRPMFDSSIIVEVDSLGDSTEMIVVDTVLPEPVIVTFETGPYSQSFTLAELASLDTLVTLADSNSISFHGFRFDRMPCPRGFLAGRWGFNEEGNGVFRGMWMSRSGRIEGYLKGHFGVNDIGHRLFFGKWISESGKFEGFLKGNWNPYPDVSADNVAFVRSGGSFEGRIFSENRRPIGSLKGRYRSSSDENHGYFQGRWKIHCPDNMIDDTRENEDGF